MGEPWPRTGGREKVDRLLRGALQQAMNALAAVAGTVYLLSDDGEFLDTVMLGGTPPEIFIMPERPPLNSGNTSSTALRTGRVAVVGEPAMCTSDAVLDTARELPTPYSTVSAPLIRGSTRYGALTVIRIPDREGPLGTTGCLFLKEIADRLARDLAALADSGHSVASRPRPALFPLLRPPPPDAEWGLPGVIGSAAINMMWVIHRLYPWLSAALTSEEVASATRLRIMAPLGAQAMALTAVGDGRLWVMGHHGMSPRAISQLHGVSAEAGNPGADALAHGAIFLSGLNPLHANYQPPSPFENLPTWAILPLRAGGHRVGVLNLGFSKERGFEPEEQALMAMITNLLGSALERVRLSESEHTLAVSLQRKLLPVLPDVSELVTTARYLPAPGGGGAGAGGDWYDVIPVPDGRIGLVIGDVEGHALEAAGVMGQLRSAVRAYTTEGHDPAAILTRAAAFLTETELTELLATCCVIRFDPADGTVEAALAGHPAPLIRLPDGRIAPLAAPPGVPLGVAPPEPYQNFETIIGPGTVVALYTDGLCHARTADVITDAQDLFLRSIRDADHDLEGLADRIIAGAPGPPDRRDDVALLLCEVEALRGDPLRGTASMSIARHDLRGPEATRSFIRRTVGKWGLETAANELELIGTEIVTNALIHADTDVELRLRRYPDRIRIEARDASVRLPVPSPIAAEEEAQEAEHGRGLIIVAAIAKDYGTSPTGRGKTFWAEVALAT
ncbi:SpoIIE family protein phosphatase [Streptomyces tubercidicus]|uniref:SpoIIE family protein phosphatase n=1 Tax=Streptomyces tubercidicus TaxID=47759 RepID=UPI0036B13607